VRKKSFYISHELALNIVVAETLALRRQGHSAKITMQGCPFRKRYPKIDLDYTRFWGTFGFPALRIDRHQSLALVVALVRYNCAHQRL
jgi:hypothetical protein